MTDGCWRVAKAFQPVSRIAVWMLETACVGRAHVARPETSPVQKNRLGSSRQLMFP